MISHRSPHMMNYDIKLSTEPTNDEVGLRLAATGAIKEDVVGVTRLADYIYKSCGTCIEGLPSLEEQRLSIDGDEYDDEPGRKDSFGCASGSKCVPLNDEAYWLTIRRCVAVWLGRSSKAQQMHLKNFYNARQDKKRR